MKCKNTRQRNTARKQPEAPMSNDTINNLGFNNACRTINNNIHTNHEQSNKKLILNKQNKNTFTVFHQNIQGLLNKKEELLNSLIRNSPQIICIKEHHLIEGQLEGITLHPFIPIP